MSQYRARVSWVNGGPDFLNGQYSRVHQWHFEGGPTIDATAAPAIVPAPWSEAANVDPEQAFVASLSSCHMLFFLSLAARQGIVVDEYIDAASGVMEQRDDGKTAMTRVTLRPDATYSGDQVPDQKALHELHHRAHELCFIANSVLTEIIVEIVA